MNDSDNGRKDAGPWVYYKLNCGSGELIRLEPACLSTQAAKLCHVILDIGRIICIILARQLTVCCGQMRIVFSSCSESRHDKTSLRVSEQVRHKLNCHSHRRRLEA